MGQKKATLLRLLESSTTAHIGQAFRGLGDNGDAGMTWEEFVAAAERKIKRVETVKFKICKVMQTNSSGVILNDLFDMLGKSDDDKVDRKSWAHRSKHQQYILTTHFGDSTPAEI